MKKLTSFDVWNAAAGSFFGNYAANVCPWRPWRGSWRTMVGTLSEAMPRPAMLRADTLVSVLAVDVVTYGAGRARTTRRYAGAHIIGMAAVTGEAVTGEAITGIRPMDIPVRLLRLGLWLSILRILAYYGYRYGGLSCTTEIGDTTLTVYGYWPSVTFSFGY